ncbi:MAG: hypothetical protein ACLQLG_19790 [Thermoguttaceae bacterium]
MTCKTKCYPCRCGAAEGERLKADALALLEARREVYVRRGRRALLRAMLDGDGRATADDVYVVVELAPGTDPRCLGSVPGALAYAKIIRAAGFVRSTRPERHASWLQVWELADRGKALRWLADHPDLPDPADADQAAGSQRVLFSIHTTNEPTPTVAAAGAGMEQ